MRDFFCFGRRPKQPVGFASTFSPNLQPPARSRLSIPRNRDEAAGVIKRLYGIHFPPGEPSGEVTADVQLRFVRRRRFEGAMLDRIRDEIWLNWGNVCFNLIGALTHATLDVICCDPATRALSRAIMLETQAIAASLGAKLRVDVERQIEAVRKVGAHKTSVLQDLERRRPMEIDPPVTVV